MKPALLAITLSLALFGSTFVSAQEEPVPDEATPDPSFASLAASQCGLPQAAFCDTFDQPAGTGTRSGDLDGTIWGASRTTGYTNFGQSEYNAWAPTQLQGCAGTTTVVPPHDILICNGQLREAVNDNPSGQFENGGVMTLAVYPKQPFDFVGRTGKVVFDVSNDTAGIHAAWPEFWLTDTPAPAPFTHFDSWQAVPQNAVGVRFAASVGPNQFGECPSFPATTRWTVDSAVVVRNYVVDDTTTPVNRSAMKVAQTDCVVSSTGPGSMNHVELNISQNQIDVYASDAGTMAPLKKIAVISNANLTLSRGLIWLEDAHYNADKGVQGSFTVSQRQHTFAWDNVGFDGPFTYKDLSFDALDNNQTVPPYGQVNLGRFSAANQNASWSVLGMPAGPASQAVRVLFNFFHYAPPNTLQVTVNGHPHAVQWPYPERTSLTWRTMAVTIPITELVTGTNIVTIGSDQAIVSANVDIVLVNVSGSGPTSTPVPAATPTPVAAGATATAVSATATAVATPESVDCRVKVEINGLEGDWQAC